MSVRYEGSPMTYAQWLENAGVPSMPAIAEAYRRYLLRFDAETRDGCRHDSLSGDEGPISELERWPTRWRCDSCGAAVGNGAPQQEAGDE